MKTYFAIHTKFDLILFNIFFNVTTMKTNCVIHTKCLTYEKENNGFPKFVSQNFISITRI